MQTIQTLEELIHAAMNSLSLISSHSQYLLNKLGAEDKSKRSLMTIWEEAERTARLISLVPQELANVQVRGMLDDLGAAGEPEMPREDAPGRLGKGTVKQ